MKLPANYNNLNQNERRNVRNLYVFLQKGFCYYCKKSLNEKPEMNLKIKWNLFPENFLKYPVHLHHCHVSGMTIGAVHSYCNAVLWQYHGQ